MNKVERGQDLMHFLFVLKIIGQALINDVHEDVHEVVGDDGNDVGHGNDLDHSHLRVLRDHPCPLFLFLVLVWNDLVGC